jgi:hypothetical protein
LWKSEWDCLRKSKIQLPYDPTIPLLGIILKESKSAYNRHSILIAAMYGINLGVNRWKDKEKMVYKDNEVWNYVICRIIDGTGDHNVKQNVKLERQIFPILSYI